MTANLPLTDPLAILLADLTLCDRAVMREIEQSIYDQARGVCWSCGVNVKLSGYCSLCSESIVHP